MIPHDEFERAINQWKIRQQGGQVVAPVGEAPSGAVMGEMALANAEPGLAADEALGADADRNSMLRSFDPE
jgi:hypothetical protein